MNGRSRLLAADRLGSRLQRMFPARVPERAGQSLRQAQVGGQAATGVTPQIHPDGTARMHGFTPCPTQRPELRGDFHARVTERRRSHPQHRREKVEQRRRAPRVAIRARGPQIGNLRRRAKTHRREFEPLFQPAKRPVEPPRRTVRFKPIMRPEYAGANRPRVRPPQSRERRVGLPRVQRARQQRRALRVVGKLRARRVVGEALFFPGPE